MSQCGRPECYITDLHTHSTGTDGVIGQVCKHGSLARSCYTCELEAENAKLKEEIEKSHKTFNSIDESCSKTSKMLIEACMKNKSLWEQFNLWKSENEKLKERERVYVKALEAIAFGSLEQTFHQITEMTEQQIAEEALKHGEPK